MARFGKPLHWLRVKLKRWFLSIFLYQLDVWFCHLYIYPYLLWGQSWSRYKGRYTGEVFPSPKDMRNQVAILVLPLHALWAGLNDVPLWDSVVWWANIVRIKQDGVQHCAGHILGTQKSGTCYYGSCCHPLEQCFYQLQVMTRELTNQLSEL